MELLRNLYSERLEEIDSFLELIRKIQDFLQEGEVKVNVFDDGEIKPGISYEITTDHQKILTSSAYVQLYSLVEALASQTFEYIAKHITSTCQFEELNEIFKREWVDYQAKIHDREITLDGRSRAAVFLTKHLLSTPAEMLSFKIEKRNAKGWDTKIIDGVLTRIGMSINLEPDLYSKLNQRRYNDMGPLTYLKIIRNQLSHGDKSFIETGQSTTIEELKDIRDIACEYLNSLLDSCQSFLDSEAYKSAEARATNGDDGGTAA